MAMKKHLLLINENSGAVSAVGTQPCVEALSQVLKGTIDVEIASGDPACLIKAARAAVTAGDLDRVYLAGGDGTCAAVAGVLARSDIALAPLPGGTMNAFSRDLGYSANLLEAIGQLSTTAQQRVDIAYANEFAFLNNIVIGAYTTVADSREQLREAEGVGEVLDSIAEIAGSIAYADTERYKVTVDGVVERVLTNTLMVANNLYDGADELRPTRADLRGGQLGCYLTTSTTAIDFLAVLMDAITGKLAESELMNVRACQACCIESESGLLEVSIDGEARELASPVRVSVKPGALRILAPDTTRQRA